MQRDVARLQTWQAVLGLAAAILGILAYTRHKASSSEAAQQMGAPVGPAGFGEVAGGGGGSSSSSTPSSPARTGEQSPSAGNPEAGGRVGVQIEPRAIIEPKLVAKNPPSEAEPGESQHEFEQRRLHTAVPGAAHA